MSKNDFPTFLLANNEKANPGQDYILHLKTPAFFAQVYKFKSEAERAQFHAQFMEQCEAENFPFVGSQSKKAVKGLYYYFAVVRFFQVPEPTEQAVNKLARTTRRMSDWYIYNILNN